MKKYSKIIPIVLFFIVCFSVKSFAMPSHTKSFYVNDFANVLDDTTKSYILSNSKALDESTTAQVVVATVESLEGKDIDSYALSLARDWEIGNKEKNNGVLILLSIGDRKVKIEVGYGLEGALNDGKVGRILDNYAVSYFKNNDWNSGIKGAYEAVVAEVYKEYGKEVPEDISKAVVSSESGGNVGLVMAAIVAIIIIISFYVIRRKNKGIDDRDNWNGPGGFGGFGGFGGGNFGGGSGNFGGGGSFGGGGASRGF